MLLMFCLMFSELVHRSVQNMFVNYYKHIRINISGVDRYPKFNGISASFKLFRVVVMIVYVMSFVYSFCQ